MTEIKVGDTVRTKAGDRYRKEEARQELLEVVGPAKPFRQYAAWRCRKPNGDISTFLEKNLYKPGPYCQGEEPLTGECQYCGKTIPESDLICCPDCPNQGLDASEFTEYTRSDLVEQLQSKVRRLERAAGWALDIVGDEYSEGYNTAVARMLREALDQGEETFVRT